MDVRGKPLGAQHLRVQEPTHLWRGKGRNVAEPCGAQRTLAFGLHHAAVADKDQLGDPKTGPERVHLLGHGDRIGRIALIHVHGQGLALRRGQ